MKFIDQEDFSAKLTSQQIFIYFIIRNNEVIYVGQTYAGMTRVYQHMMPCDEIKIIYKSRDFLGAWETSYITKYRPEYNKNIYGESILKLIRNKLRDLYGPEMSMTDVKKFLKSIAVEILYEDGFPYVPPSELDIIESAITHYIS